MLRDILYLVIGLIAGGAAGFFIARNYMKSQGKDFDQEFNNFKEMFK